MSIRPKVGDVFLVPLDETSAAGGHVIDIRENAEVYLAVFDQRVSLNETNSLVALSGKPALLALTFDAKFWHGNWPIIGNQIHTVDQYPEPAYKIKHAGVMSVESRDKSIRRPASPHDLEILQFRSVAAPIIIENAIKAQFGIGEWDINNDELLAGYAIASSQLI